jgi:hypothetical protein
MARHGKRVMFTILLCLMAISFSLMSLTTLQSNIDNRVDVYKIAVSNTKMLISFTKDIMHPSSGEVVHITPYIIYDGDGAEVTNYDMVITRDDAIWKAFDEVNVSTGFYDSGSDVTHVYDVSSIIEHTYSITDFESTAINVHWYGAHSETDTTTDWSSWRYIGDDPFLLFLFLIIMMLIMGGCCGCRRCGRCAGCAEELGCERTTEEVTSLGASLAAMLHWHRKTSSNNTGRYIWGGMKLITPFRYIKRELTKDGKGYVNVIKAIMKSLRFKR